MKTHVRNCLYLRGDWGVEIDREEELVEIVERECAPSELGDVVSFP